MTYWKESLRENITSVEGLRKALPLTRQEYSAFKQIHRNYPVNITRYYLSLIDPHDADDPIRKMIVPCMGEYAGRGYIDTSGELDNTKVTGLQHKYSQTALLLLTSYCFANCRFCFRKRFVGLNDNEVLRDVDSAVAYIKEHEEITNLLLSGGDALSLDNRVLGKIFSRLEGIPHLKFVRIGTRVPVVFPERVLTDRGLIRLLRRYSHQDRKIIIQTHYNHPKELTSESAECLAVLRKAGMMIHNQTVLLKGVNDDPSVLSELMSRLISLGTHPYYLFQCRPVRGTMHMQVPIVKGYRLVEEAKARLSGPSKMFKYAMSHRTGKIEIIGMDEESIYFKYHQAKDLRKMGKFFSLPRVDSACWFDDVVHHRKELAEMSGESRVD